MWYLNIIHGDIVKVHLDKFEMFLSTTDVGLSRQLLVHHSRENISTRVFISELQKISKEVPQVSIIEVGANIGYFVLVEATTLGENVLIHAFEPSTENYDLLNKNIRSNDVSSRVQTVHAAVGRQSGTAMLDISTKSNQNQIRSKDTNSTDPHIRDHREVEMTSMDEYLSTINKDLSSINVIRMDIQGYELEALQGMKNVLAGDQPMIIFIETHPNYMESDRHEEVISILIQSGFELVSAADDNKTYDISDLLDERVYEVPLELILKRGY